MRRTRYQDSKQSSPPMTQVDYDPVRKQRFVVMTIDPGPGNTGSQKLMVDEPNPHYHKRKAAGEIMMGYMSLIVSDRSASASTIHLGDHVVWGWREVSGDLAALVEQHLEWPTVDQRPAAVAAESALLSAYSTMNSSSVLSGEIVGDIDKTLAMLTDPLKRAVKLVKSTKTAYVGEVLRLSVRKQRSRRNTKTDTFKREGHLISAQALSNAFLQTRYGWLPAIKDTHEIMRMAKSIHDKAGSRRRVARGSREGSSPWHGSFNGGPGIIPGTSGVKCQYSQEWRYKAAAGVIYEVKTLNVGDKLAEDLGLGLHNLPTTAYELTPFSFVVDWFSNMGDFIRASVPNPNVVVLKSWLTTIHTMRRYVNSCETWVSLGSFTWQDSEGKVQRSDPVTYKCSFSGSSTKEDTVIRQPDPALPAYPSFVSGSTTKLNTATGVALLTGTVVSGLRSLRT